MKVKEFYSGHNGFIGVGDYCAFIEFDEIGVDISPKAISEKLEPYHRAVLVGNVFEDKLELKELLNKVIKNNKDFTFELFASAETKPGGFMFAPKNLLFNIFITEDDTEHMMQIGWFKTWHARFIFTVNKLQDINAAMALAQKLTIPKHMMWLDITSSDRLNDFISEARVQGINIAPRLREWLWKNIGREDGNPVE